MEWIETTAASVAEAKELAIDKLGVDESETEFEVLEEPRQGLFGRTRGQARVRARVRPKMPRSKDERNDRRRGRKRGGGQAGPGDQESGTSRGADRSGEEASAGGRGSAGSGSRGDEPKKQAARSQNSESRGAKKMQQASVEEVEASVESFLTGLVSAFGLESEIGLEHDNEEVRAEIKGKHGLLLGPKARTLDAIQELARVTASREAPSSVRVKVDVGGYREARKVALGEFARQAAERAVSEGIEVVLEPMSSADRKIVHDTINDIEGVSTRSAGNDPRRRVVVVPELSAEADDGPQAGDDDDR